MPSMNRMGLCIKTYGDAEVAEAIANATAINAIRKLEMRLEFAKMRNEAYWQERIAAMNERYARTWCPGKAAAKLWGLIGLATTIFMKEEKNGRTA